MSWNEGKKTFDTQGIWDAFSDRLRSFVRRRVEHGPDVDDILQDVFYKIHSNLHQLKAEERLESWVYQIARNAVNDYYRRRQRVILDITEVPDLPSEAATSAEIVPEGLVECLKPMIDRLPEKYRRAIMLTEYRGLRQKQVAQEMGLSLSGAKSRVQRARGKLKEMLEACCHFEFDRSGNILDYQPKDPSCSYCLADRDQK